MHKPVCYMFKSREATKDAYLYLFTLMVESKIETWFLPPGYRIYQDSADPFDYYRFSSHPQYNVSNNINHDGTLLFSAIKRAHKHYQEKMLIAALNEGANKDSK